MTDEEMISGNGVPELERLRAIMHRLRAPGGCPWDAEQTHESLVPNLIEEAYETVDAIKRGDDTDIREELGDLLLQVYFHSEIAQETGRFDLDAVAKGISDKLIRRHPHVFGDTTANTSAAVLNQWDAIKRTEKGTEHEGLLHGTGNGLPALMRAQKLQKKAARVGFDWPDAIPVFAKIREEAVELEEAIASGDKVHMEDELGDLLFSVVNLARKLGIESEPALAAANEKFTRRFHAMETHLREQGHELGKLSLEQMDTAWDAVKHSV